MSDTVIVVPDGDDSDESDENRAAEREADHARHEAEDAEDAADDAEEAAEEATEAADESQEAAQVSIAVAGEVLSSEERVQRAIDSIPEIVARTVAETMAAMKVTNGQTEMVDTDGDGVPDTPVEIPEDTPPRTNHWFWEPFGKGNR